jgi:hypothetical protein
MDVRRRFVARRVTAFTGALLLAAATGWADVPGSPVTDDTSQADPNNYCIGGLENRKVIVEEDFLSNPFKETTHLGCEVDGGKPAEMPDLPQPAARRFVLA